LNLNYNFFLNKAKASRVQLYSDTILFLQKHGNEWANKKFLYLYVIIYNSSLSITVDLELH